MGTVKLGEKPVADTIGDGDHVIAEIGKNIRRIPIKTLRISLRKPTALDFSNWDSGAFTETVDGDVLETYQVTFDSAGNPVSITDSVGHKTTITW